MKRRILLLVLMLTMLLSAFMLATVASAECSATQGDNIAASALISPDASQSWYAVRPQYLVDGKTNFGTVGPKGGPYYYTFEFTDPQLLSSTTVYCNGSGAAYYNGPDTQGDLVSEYQKITYSNHFPNTSVQVKYLDADGNVVYESEVFNTTSARSITATPPDGIMAKKVQVHVVCTDIWQYENSASIVYEVQIFKQNGTHDWSLKSTTEPADCENDGTGVYSCSCGNEKTDIIPAKGHYLGSYIPDSDDATKHYRTCLYTVDCSQDAGTKLVYEDHVYDNECDDSCNLCNVKTRDVEPHLYVSDCDVHCNKCNLLRAPANGAQHAFAYACTPECANCREPNPNWVDHTYSSACDTTCNFCSLERAVEPHVFESDCDEYCNVEGCDFRRTKADDERLIDHHYSSECDVSCNNDGCTHIRTAPIEHPFKNNCDEKCDKCNALNPDYVAGHLYDNDCDADCNECRQKRNVDDHKYDNVCDNICNTCGTQRTVSKHIYGDWITLIPASETSEGVRAHYCINCQNEEQETLPMLEKTGLSTGAIVGIVAGSSAVVLACAGIGVYSLVIKPKMETKKRLEAEAAKKKAEEDDDEYEDDEEDEDSES